MDSKIVSCPNCDHPRESSKVRVCEKCKWEYWRVLYLPREKHPPYFMRILPRMVTSEFRTNPDGGNCLVWGPEAFYENLLDEISKHGIEVLPAANTPDIIPENRGDSLAIIGKDMKLYINIKKKKKKK